MGMEPAAAVGQAGWRMRLEDRVTGARASRDARLVSVGRSFVAVGLIGLGVEHFLFGEFVTGRAPTWPEAVPGGGLWAWATGMVFVLTGVAILTGRRARPAAALAAALILLWAFVRHLPVVVAAPLLSGEWTRAGKALTFGGGLLAVAATFPQVEEGRTGRPDGRRSLVLRTVNLRGELIVVGRLCLGLFFVLTGIQHFIYTDFVASLIPAWFPGDAVFWTGFAGVALICAGLGLFVPATARLAALLSGLMVFSWFWIVHLPRTLGGVSDRIAVFEALVASGIALVLAGCPPGPGPRGEKALPELISSGREGPAGPS